MAVPTSAQFLNRFPEYGEQPAPVIEGALAEAGRSTPESVWRQFHTDAVGYLAAHLLAGRVMQIGYQIGQLSGTPLGEDLKSTLYGREYERLRDSLPLTGFVV